MSYFCIPTLGAQICGRKLFLRYRLTIDNTKNNFSKRKNSDERSYKRGLLKVV